MLSSVVSLATAKQTETVSVSEVEKVAKKFFEKISATNDFKEWKTAEIGRIVPAYDVNENITAYIIELVKDGSYAGYVVVSAKKTNYPILEFSKGKSPLMRARELEIKTEKVYYLGALSYLFKEKEGTYRDLMKREFDFEKVKNGVIKAMKSEKVRHQLIKRTLEAREQWKLYETKGSVGTLSWYGNHILGVPALAWDDGCTPTAAAMVLEYWGEHGYSNLDYPDWWYWEDSDWGDGNGYDDPSDEHTDLTEKLHNAMGTWDWNGYTPPANVASGINDVINDHGYGDWASDVSADYNWDWTVDEINSGYPYILTMWYYWPNSDYWPGHSVTVIGYRLNIETNEKQLMVYDTHSPYDEIVFIAFGNWLGANAYSVHPS